MKSFRTFIIGSLCIAAGILLGPRTLDIPLTRFAPFYEKPAPRWSEKMLELTDEERSTMSGYFPTELEQALASYSAVLALPTPTPLRYLSPPTPTFAPYISFTAGPTGATGIIGPLHTSQPSPLTPTLVLQTPQPSPTRIPTRISTSTPLPTPTALPTPTQPQSADTTAPTITINGGLEEGAFTYETTVCFPLWIVDDLSWYSAVLIRYRIDKMPWGMWMYEYQPCVFNLSKGPHTFSVQGKDEAGNISSEVTRHFVVQ